MMDVLHALGTLGDSRSQMDLGQTIRESKRIILKSKYKTPRLWLEYQNSFDLVTGSPTIRSTVIRAVPRAHLARETFDSLSKPLE